MFEVTYTNNGETFTKTGFTTKRRAREFAESLPAAWNAQVNF